MDAYQQALVRLLGQQPQQWEAPIDPSRPVINNPDGSISTERTTTFGEPGNFVNMPTIVNGAEVPPMVAGQLNAWGVNPETGRFPTLEQAENAAVMRSQEIGRRHR